MTKVPKVALTVKQFMLRQEVLKLYREIFRTIRQVPDKHSQAELRAWARHDFQTNRSQSDEVAIKMLMQHGPRSLTELKTSLQLSGVSEEEK
ncbi:LYR motif-containing protein 2-like [Drosophila miranda]|uniref:LYR motif-containing protein 2-like n=1 Tax=Drosophila miranda TaxID=7229 RepID=UPI00143F4D5E|nr:LYR motif-containing protein 2-like [Drosophila miranda]XP_033254688.1 LYR motif-containing protein 2-like [Drosophila miranda]